MIRRVHANYGGTTTRRRPLHQQQLGDFPILPEILRRAQSGYELVIEAVLVVYLCAKWSITHLLFGEPRANANNVDYVALDDPHIRKVATAKGIEFLSLPLPLFLLLGEALMTKAQNKTINTTRFSGQGKTKDQRQR